MKKATEKKIETLRDWGYVVNELDSGTLYVQSEFCTLYVQPDDVEVLGSLTDRDAHIERVQQMVETREETVERHSVEAEE